ncbi:MAG: hypothetical protein ABI977_33525 [Acidobacteriota bacterium]
MKLRKILAPILFTLFLAITIMTGARAATVTPVASGLNAAIGQAYNAAENTIYFVEYSSGEFSKLNLTTGIVTVIQTGFTQPESVALLPGYHLAYVTTRDGKLWKCSTGSTTRTLVASGLGAPHAIVIDPMAFVAYVTDFSGGNLWKVNLGGGAHTAILSGLTNPLGLLLSADYRTAYVAEPNRILQIDLTAPARIPLVTGLTNAFFMDWANDARTVIYYVERDPANRVSLLDVPTRTASFIANVASRPSSVVRSSDPNAIYVASDSVIQKVLLAGAGGPVITRVGFIPSTEIDFPSGQATTDPSYFFHVKNASFGGSNHVMLNYPGMRSSGATYYKILLDGAAATSPETASWVNYKWNGTTFVPQTVAPNASGFYRVPAAGDLWAIPDLGFVLNSLPLSNGRHVVRIKLYNFFFGQLSGDAEDDKVALLIDNDPPVVSIDRIEHDGSVLDECALVTSGSATFVITFSAYDRQSHLYSYALTDGWGRNRSYQVVEDHYVGVHDSAPTWFGVNPRVVAHDLNTTCTKCAHAFTVSATGNTTDGYNYIHHVQFSEHLAIYVPGMCH